MSSLPIGDILRASNQCIISLSQTKIPLKLFKSGGNGVKNSFSTYFQFTFKLSHSVTAAKLEFTSKCLAIKFYSSSTKY